MELKSEYVEIPDDTRLAVDVWMPDPKAHPDPPRSCLPPAIGDLNILNGDPCQVSDGNLIIRSSSRRRVFNFHVWG